MRDVLLSGFLCALLFASAGAATGADTPAAAAFAAGDFGAAASDYAAQLAAHPGDPEAALNLGAIRLYENDLAAAEPLLRAANAVPSPSPRAAALLRELERRKAEASRKTVVAGGEAVVPFVTSKPLPVVRATIDGHPATLVVDTGGTLDLDPQFAARLGLHVEDAGTGIFAGGKRAPIQRTHVRSIALGGAVSYDVDASVSPTHADAMFKDVHADGIVGTTVFERFLVTMDFPNARLVLRPRSAEVSARFQAAAKSSGATIVPCWLVGDHFVFANAQVNAAPPGLFLFDSGLAGGGVSPTRALVESAGIKLDESHAGTGMGGGGAVRIIPFVADRVAVGTTMQRDIRGIYSPEGSPFVIFPFNVLGAISNEFLAHYAYTVDFDAMTIVLASPKAASARPSASSVDAYLRSLVPYGFSGNAVVAHGSKIDMLAAYGMADRERKIPMQADTVISVGSITKQFTAAAVLKLQESGKLSVHDSIAKYLPGVPADKQSITLHELLTHTSGIQSDFGGDFEPIGRDAFVARALQAPLEAAPGTRFSYSNAGYSLLAAIVERVSRMSYEQFLRTALFLPAGMRETGYVLPHWSPGRIAIGYDRHGERWGTIPEHGWSASGPYWNLLGNGGILSTPSDMARWSVALQQHRVLSKTSVDALQTGYVEEPQSGGERYGYGWDVSQTPHGKLVSHNGGNGIFAAEFLRFVDNGTTVYVATNAANVPAAALEGGLAAAAFGEKDPPAPTQDLARRDLDPALSGTVTLPMDPGPLPVVELVVDGKGPYRFGIETGAPFVAVRSRVIDDLNLTPTARGEVPLYTLRSISAGGLRYENVPAVGMRFADSSIDGVLGLNAFATVLLTLDYPQRKVVLSRDTLPPADGKTVFPAERIAFGYGVHLDFGGVAADAFIDTRSHTPFSVSPAFAQRLAFQSPPVVVGKAAGAAFGPTELREGRLAGDVRFGDFTIKSPTVDIVRLPPFLPQEPLLGAETLSHFVVSLDQRAKRVRFTLPGEQTEVNPRSERAYAVAHS